MKYISCDIETTSLDPLNGDILEIGAIIEDTNNPLPREQCPTFHCYVDKSTYRGDAFAINMNAGIFKKICDIRKETSCQLVKREEKGLIYEPEVAIKFSKFLQDNGISKVIAAGKNFAGFDKKFLDELPLFKELITFHHRTIDPSMLYMDFKNDTAPPDLATCKKRAGLPETVSHLALDDAWDVIELLRVKY